MDLSLLCIAFMMRPRPRPTAHTRAVVHSALGRFCQKLLSTSWRRDAQRLVLSPPRLKEQHAEVQKQDTALKLRRRYFGLRPTFKLLFEHYAQQNDNGDITAQHFEGLATTLFGPSKPYDTIRSYDDARPQHTSTHR